MKVEIIQQKYILSMNEFAILANRCGIHRVFSFLESQHETMGKETFIQILHQLMKKGLVTLEQDTFQVKQPFTSYFAQIKSAKEAITIETDKGVYAGKCCYLSDDDRILITESTDTREDAIRMYQVEKKEFLGRILEEGYLTYDERDVDYNRRTEKRILTTVKWWDLVKETLIREVHFCLQNSQCFIEQGMGEQMARIPYDTQVLVKLIQEMAGGEEDASGGLIRTVLK
ncbi:hypothetical protein [Anaerosporobacter faecicola]|uniref:hypothetical protein n=1 Tax=Anaerosporobacter faecicola TaxID=2718714 RepID=UPI0014389D71|nr:hypothetical protein [Anaerosporobacter faecicola]